MRVPRLLALLLLLAVCAPAAGAAGPARLHFAKTFPGSLPEHVAVTIAETGEGSFAGGAQANPSLPESFRLSPEVTTRLFALAAELNFFRGVELEVKHRVAFLGQKVLAYEKDGARSEVTFNYTENAAGAELQRWLEGIARGRWLISRLEANLQYDRLGALATLSELEKTFNAGELVDLTQFVPALTRAANDARVMRLARAKAQRLAERIGGAPPRVQFERFQERAGWYAQITVEEGRGASYEARRMDREGQPQPLALSRRTRERFAELLRQADYFRANEAIEEPGRAERRYRLTYEAGTESNQAAFVEPPAGPLAELVRLFESLLLQEEFRGRLRQALEQDPLELGLVLRDLGEAVRQRGLAEPEEFVAPLEKIAAGEDYLPAERDLAKKVLAQLRSPS